MRISIFTIVSFECACLELPEPNRARAGQWPCGDSLLPHHAKATCRAKAKRRRECRRMRGRSSKFDFKY